MWVICGVLPVFQSFSQQPKSSEKPKIGLVLSGGGAKGMAHIGILRYMEKAGIRPDYIVGTSMGAVVGGLYALGYSADELEAIVRSIDWEIIVSNRVGFDDISFEEKEYYNRYLIELPVVNWKVGIPSGLIEGQKLSETLHFYTWPANNIRNFDELPIPFRCITTDIRNGEGIVIKEGYLHDAMRASIAIPTFFTPFDMDSTWVVDGGVVNNFPVDVVKEMGAEIVIGVNVGDEDFLDPRDLSSFSGILMQIAMTQSYSKLIQNIADCDIYIKPDLKNNSTASFGRFNEILNLGDEAGKQHAWQFQTLADSLQIYEATPGIGLVVAPLTLSAIELRGNELFSDDLIMSKLGISAGDTITREELQEGISRVFGINGFNRVGYSLALNEDQTYGLQLSMHEKPKNLLFASFHYDDLFSAGILLNLTARDLIGRSSRTVFITDISQNPKFRVDHYKYLGREKRFALNLRYNYLNQRTPTFTEGRPDDVFLNRESRLSAQLMSIRSLKETFVFGMFHETNRSRSKFGINFPEDIRRANRNFYAFRFLYYRNSLNDRNYATEGAESIIEPIYHFGNTYGIRLNNNVDTLFWENEGQLITIPESEIPGFIDGVTPNGYLSIYLKYTKFFTLAHRFQIAPLVNAGLTFSTQGENYIFNNFIVGGYQRVRFNDTRVYGLNYRELFVPNFVRAGFELQFVPHNNVYLRAGTNFVGYADHVPLGSNNSSLLESLFDSDGILGYGADITLKTLLGPVTVGLGSNSSDGRLRYYLSIGFSFNYADR
ncbi:patatin-like phospholipase family protein [Pararhodonellum marinum]|uniref:patatin-like phospholipase family protein n=1 Tax=Pararhodonellum marinum TaxID=2755358 RepID=UPI001E5E289E|nr:patatin-like phospholipase family protein [Pararhodonellum marinum]